MDHQGRQAGTGLAPVAVGVIGLGIMGRPMAGHLLTGLPEGSSLHLSDRDEAAADALVAAGAHWHNDAAGVGAASEVVIVMVPTLAHVLEVLEGERGLLAVTSPTVVAVSSTVSPDGVRDLGRSVAERTGGLVRVVDAPVSGGEEGAIVGTLSVMIGGDAQAVAEVLPLYALMGTAVHLGPLGAGQVAKACNQMIVAATVTALAEAAVLAERSGLDLVQMFDLLETGYAGSRIMAVKKRRLAEHDHRPSGPAKFMIKDLQSAQEAARRTGTPTPQTDVLLQLFTDLTAQGLGDLDTAVVQAYLESQHRPETQR